MDWEIGEIRQINDEWYQCLESNNCRCDCDDCDLDKIVDCCEITCTGNERIDNKEVCFKKLEKVGKPYNDCGTILQRFKIYTNVTNADTKGLELHIYSNNTIGIEIKQIKEDMEDNRTINQQFAECGQTINDVVRKCYTENKSMQIKDMEEYKMYDAKEDIPEFDKAVDECLFGKQELKLKPFDLQKAKAGKPVCTRDGRSVRILCFDAKRRDEKNIIALVPSKGYPGFEDLIAYPDNGIYYGEHENDNNLMMMPEKKEGWVNVYKGGLLDTKSYPTEKEAFDKASLNDYVDTVKINWEE